MDNNYQFGVDYYPEQWGPKRWPIDLKMMKDMGIDVIRMAEFAWSSLEPADGQFDFAWLDEVLRQCQELGLKVVLGTPTAAPPIWLVRQHPDVLPVDHTGQRRTFGGRHHDCQSNPIYRQYIKRYVEKFSQHFGDNPAVIGWQIDNELGNSHYDLCYCDYCQAHFQQWLAKKYLTIDNLNERWGTKFWSQTYQDFTQIQGPMLPASGSNNPSLELDWKLCHSDLINEFHAFQAQIIRKNSPERFITHNMMGFSDVVSYYDLGRQLDFAAHDQYPGGHFQNSQTGYKGAQSAIDLDFIRGVKNKNFWIMEQQSTITGWEILGRSPKPGQIGLWSFQSYAHGADTIVYFRWRSSPVGTEQYWQGILPHSGIPGRAYDEISDFIARCKPLLRETKGLMPRTEVGIVYDYAQNYAFTIQPNHPDLTYVGHLQTYYNALYDKNIPTDFIPKDADFMAYKVIIAPLQYLMTPELAEKYRNYVRQGGKLILTMRTGVKDATNRCLTTGSLPGELRDILGLEVSEYDCLRDEDVKIAWDGKTYTGVKWADMITPKTAQTLATYASEFYAGTPAITVNDFGQGQAYYVGTEMAPELAARMITELLPNLTQPVATPSGVEIAYRENDQHRYCLVLNHTESEQPLQLPANWHSYFPDQKRQSIAPLSYQAYRVDKA